MGITLLFLAILFPINVWTFHSNGDLPPADMGLLMKMTADRFGARVQKAAQRPGEPPNTWECEHVTAVPDNVRREMNLNRFYQKYLHAFGVPIISSNLAKDAALRRACYVVVFTLADRQDIRRMFYKNHGRAAVISVREHVTTIPEHSWLPSWWNQRARGLGGTMQNPISTCGEENILCHSSDPWGREDIFLHEYVHGLHNVGVTSVIRDFDSRLNARYRYLKRTGLKWRNTYAMSTDREYLAEGAQSYFEDNDEQIPGNGIHNHVNTRAELFSYDRDLYNFVNEIFPCKNKLLLRCDAINGAKPYHFKMNCDKNGNGILMDFKTKKPVGGGPDTPPPLTNPPPQSPPPLTNPPPQSPPPLTDPPPQSPPPQTVPPATNPPTTQPPPVTTAPPGNCKDDHNSCSYWARTGECQKNPGYMLKNCRKSCNVCSSVNCFDNNQSCSYWASIGECSRNPGYMKVYCKKSCNVC